MKGHLCAAALMLAFLMSASTAGAQFAQQGAKLVGTGAVGTAQQGYSVALSADGNTAVVGGHNDNGGLGAAWVYTRSSGAWSQQGAKLVGTGAAAAHQGVSVALSADGNTAIVGGFFDNSSVGAVWVYTRSGGVWSQQGAKLVGTGAVGAAEQGYSVALSADGNTAVVGGLDDNSSVGAVWVYTRSGGVWSQQGGKLVGTGAVGAAEQGYSVALSADGNTAVVGGPVDNGNAGAAWVYTRSGGVWSQEGPKLVGTGAVGSPVFQGWSVALSGAGNTATVGGPSDNGSAGAVWVYTRSGGVWSQQGAKLVGTGAVGTAVQGSSVALSGDGNTTIVGGYGDNGSVGAVWVYTRSGGVWSQQGAKLVGTGAVGFSRQGTSVALSGDAGIAVVGGPDDGTVGAAWVYVGAGVPRLEAGFPVSLPAQVVSPPGICQLDENPQSKIVLGTSDGFVRVFNHNGTAMWSQFIGAFPWHCPIAVDDLDLDGHTKVFCGNRTGFVNGFASTGVPLAGWPVNLGTHDSTYVSTGDVTGDLRDEVVACSSDAVFVLRSDGTEAPGFPVLVGSEIDASAAIGDVDGDGKSDIVVLTSGGVMHVIKGDGTIPVTRVVPGKSFKRSPALGDLNLDGTLEIVAPTITGEVYVFNHDGTDYPGAWPFVEPDVTHPPISGVALANMRSGFQPEIVFGIDRQGGTPRVHALFQDGTELSGYPRSTTPFTSVSALPSEPIIDILANASPDVLIGDPGGEGWAWTNFGVNVPGWPTDLTDPLNLFEPCVVSPATGDLDDDGRIEVVFGAYTRVTVFDLGANIYRSYAPAGPRWWPMFGYNPQRQHCLACGRYAVTGIGASVPVSTLLLDAPYPNPTRGAMRLSWTLRTPGLSRMVVHDIAGRGVRHLFQGWLPAGRHEVQWDGRDDRGGLLSPGIYFVQVEVHSSDGISRRSRSLVLLR